MNAFKKVWRFATRGTLVLFFSFFFTPFTHAHEVYVLSHQTVQEALQASGISLWDVMMQHLDQFTFWAFIGAFVVVVVFFASVSRFLERIFDPLLIKLPPYAPVIGRITIGFAFIAAAYYQSLYGPELPIESVFGAASPLVVGLLVVVGTMIIVGFYARIAAIIGLLIFVAAAVVYGSYMFTYTNYIGELLLLSILGAHKFAFHHKGHDETHAPRIFLELKEKFTPYAFPFLRVAFGISLIYASVYAKIIHNKLALTVAATPLAGHATSLASVFGFSPEFLVLGAAIVEILIGLFFILGIEIRFVSIFLIFWLSLSLWYFGEAVWPHIILIGIPLAFICYGYDRYSLEGYFFKRDGREPVL